LQTAACYILGREVVAAPGRYRSGLAVRVASELRAGEREAAAKILKELARR
jgi:hypothetical protein